MKIKDQLYEFVKPFPAKDSWAYKFECWKYDIKMLFKNWQIKLKLIKSVLLAESIQIEELDGEEDESEGNDKQYDFLSAFTNLGCVSDDALPEGELPRIIWNHDPGTKPINREHDSDNAD